MPNNHHNFQLIQYNHKLFSNNYINEFKNSVHYCINNHEDKASNNYCTKCNCLYYNSCADEHEK